MEPTGSTYLYALAAVAITFVGFSALLVIFRQARGDALTRYESYFVLSFIQPGLIVTGGALLPSVFALYGLPVAAVWRLSSIVVAVPIVVFVTTLPSRRRAATGRKTLPLYVGALGSLDLIIAVYLLVNAAGMAGSNGVGPYAASLTALLLTTVTAYVIALSVALGEAPGRTTD